MAESGQKGSPGASKPVLLSLTLAWMPKKGAGPEMSGLLLCSFHTQNRAGGFRLIQSLPTQNKQWSNAQQLSEERRGYFSVSAASSNQGLQR